MYLNIQSLRYKVDELLVLLDSCDYPSAVLICEHWLRVNESVFIDNYQVVSSFCRSVFKNGGTLVLFYLKIFLCQLIDLITYWKKKYLNFLWYIVQG